MEAPGRPPRAGPTGRRSSAARPGRQARRRRPVRRPPGGLRAGGGRDPDPGDRRRHRRVHARRPAGVPVHRVGRGQPRVRLDDAPLRVHLAGHPPFGLRPRPRDRRGRPPQAPAGAGRLRPRPLPHRAPVGRRPTTEPGCPSRWSTGPTWSPTRRPGAGRGALPPLRIRLLRGLDGPDVLVAAAQPPRPGLRLRHRPRPGRGRDGPDLVRAGEAGGQAQHLHRLRGLRPHPDRRGMDRRPTGWWPGAGAPGAC